MDQSTEVNVARDLFPSTPVFDWNSVPESSEDIVVIMDLSEDSLRVPLFAPVEVAKAVNKLPPGKALGPNLIPNELIKLAYAKFPAVFGECFNACLAAGYFPSSWKRARLVLLHKGQNKPKEVRLG